ncbi:hypothetical protein [Streptomyces sp. NPDC059256]|uniref:hypothetical protein n=1 Tax=Streptomyces sp. NPDC059256 TaxID=3346794 RepID=UPI0036CC58BC
MTTAISDSWLDEAIAELEADGYLPHQPNKPQTRARKAKAHTALTRRIHEFITREFKEGAAGNRSSLPSTYDVAKACVHGSGSRKSCSRAMRHLLLLEAMGEITRVYDPEDYDGWTSTHRITFWALPNSGLMLGGVEQPVSSPPRSPFIDHLSECTHPSTPNERDRCRKRHWMLMDVSAL